MNILSGAPTEKFQDYLNARDDHGAAREDLYAFNLTKSANPKLWVGVPGLVTLAVFWTFAMLDFLPGLVLVALMLVGIIMIVKLHPNLGPQRRKKRHELLGVIEMKDRVETHAKNEFLKLVGAVVNLEDGLRIEPFGAIRADVSSLRVKAKDGKEYRLISMDRVPCLFNADAGDVLQASYESSNRVIIIDDLGTQFTTTREAAEVLSTGA